MFGTDAADQFTIEGSLSRLRINVEVHAGGGEDRLTTIGRNRSDEVHIGENYLRFNNLNVVFGGISEIEVDARGGADFVFGQQSGVPLIVSGGNGRDYIVGSQHADLLMGGRGRDVLVGLSGNDLLIGEAGRDLLLGGAGDDLLIGGPGRDWLWGGPGSDIEIQGGFPDEDERDGALWDEALDRWNDDLLRYGIL